MIHSTKITSFPGESSTEPITAFALWSWQETIHGQVTREASHVDLSVGDRGRAELGEGPDIIPARVLFAVPQLSCCVGSIEGTHDPLHNRMLGTRVVRVRGPQNPTTGGISGGRKGHHDSL